MKVINAHIYDPKNSFFKSSANEKSACTITSCSFEGECPLLKQGKCIHLGVFDRCKFGMQRKEVGFTKRAAKYHQWISEKREKYSEILGAVKSAPKKMVVIGDFIYLPYPHLNMNKLVPFEKHGHAFVSGDTFLSINAWNIGTIKEIISFRPQAMMGGEIISYQKETIPSFVQHLREEFPELYNQLEGEVPSVSELKVNYVGRKAYLKTCKPNSTFIKSPDKPSIRQEWFWDDEKLTSPSIMTFKPFEGHIESSETVVIPSDKTTIQITDNSQVKEGETIFVD